MKVFIYVLGAVFVGLVFSPASLPAAVENSPHDLIAQDYDVPKVDPSKERCNACHLPVSSASWNFLDEIPPSLKRFGKPSLICFSCHDGTTIVSSEVDASTSAFHPSSHGYDLEYYRDQIPEELELPYLEGKRMECVTCHDPHDNSRRPFLRADIEDLCAVCHSNMVEVGRGEENLRGNHPILIDPLEAMREATPIEMELAFRVAFPSSYPLQGGKSSLGTHWNLGGHLRSGDTGMIICVTCHAVHGDEESPPENYLLTFDPINDVANVFCEGCHQGQRGDGEKSPPYPNPGGTIIARTYHPCDNDVSNGLGRFLEIREPPRWPFGEGEPKPLLCTTCHIAHGAWPKTPILRRPEKAAAFCEECHDRMPLEYHHPAGKGLEGKCSANLPPPVYGDNREGVFCSDCHRAHNAGLGTDKEDRFVPILRYSYLSKDFCLVCHPEDNPTCNDKELSRASHFLGDPTLPETYDDVTPPIRVEPWPESGIASVYGGDNNKGVICLSCHTFKEDAVVSGDEGKSRHLLARSGNPVEWEDGEEELYLCTGCHSTNPGTKGGGHTHPLMTADVSKLNPPWDPERALPTTATPGGHVNCDSCHRPHEAVSSGGYYIMEVIDSSNTDSKAIHPEIDFTVLCHKCHSEY